VSKHVAPEKWADALAGRVSLDERAQMNAHAAECDACKRAQIRVSRASDTFATLRERQAPEQPWDAIRTRVTWAVEKERRDTERTTGSVTKIPAWSISRVFTSRWTIASLAIAAAGVGIAFGVHHFRAAPQAWVATGGPGSSSEQGSAAPAKIVATPANVPGAPLGGVIVRATGNADTIAIDGAHPQDLFAQRLGTGSVIATAEARLDVQFGDGSAFALGPSSTLELRHFDSHLIELRVDGTLDVEVGPRASDQRFLVIAGEHTVEVRGTQFQVRRGAAGTTVECRHGLVAVSDKAGLVEVAAARRVTIAPDETLGGEHARDRVVPLTVDELAQLADATPMRMPVWTDADTLFADSAPLTVAAPDAKARDIRVDGIELGTAPLAIRVRPGRHLVESADREGRFRRVGWVDVATGPARIDLPAEQPPNASAAIAARKAQLVAGIDHARLAQCTRSIAKSGLSDTYVQIEIAIDANGSVGFLNVLDTDLPSATSACVRDVLAGVRFGTGAPATFRERIDL
jgi:hypothetical protein